MVKIFVGNIAEGVTDEDLRLLFEKHGKVTECDVLGSYGFVHVETESDAELAISKLDKTVVKGQAINVEKSKGVRATRGGYRGSGSGGAFPGGYASGDYGSKAQRRAGCTKLHIANLPDCVQSNELRELFERYGYVAECDVVEDRKIAFVHIEDSAAEAAIQGLNGYTYNGMSLKVQMSKNQTRSNSNNYPSPYHSSSAYGNSAPGMIPTIQGRERGVGIPVRTARVLSAYPSHDPMSRSPAPYGMPPVDPGRYAVNYEEAYTEHNLPPPAKDRMELLDLLDRRRRLEALDPYERRLIACTDVYNLPPPPPDFLRLLRERALVKARLPLPPTTAGVNRGGMQPAPASMSNNVIGVPPYSSGKISAPPVAYTGMYAQRSAAGY